MKLKIDIDEDYIKIINKNGASNYAEEVIKYGTPLNDVLDKIKAELHATSELHDDGDYYVRDEWIDEIFDIYKVGGDQE